MDKILETLSQKFSAEELNEVKKAIEFTVDEKVKAKSEQEAKMIAKKADEFCQKKIKEAVEKKTAEIEEIANNMLRIFCMEFACVSILRMPGKLAEVEFLYKFMAVSRR